MNNNNNSDDDSVSDGSSVLGLGDVDFSGVDFDVNETCASGLDLSAPLLKLDQTLALQPNELVASDKDKYTTLTNDYPKLAVVVELGQQLATGNYLNVLKGPSAQTLLSDLDLNQEKNVVTVPRLIRQQLYQQIQTPEHFLEFQLVGVAALNMYLQLNYTGPSLDQFVAKDIAQHGMQPTDPLEGIHPHASLANHLSANEPNTNVSGDTLKTNTSITTSSYVHTKFHNAVLSELAVDGEWPCQVCEVPYFLLLARSILLPLSNPGGLDWMHGVKDTTTVSKEGNDAPKLIHQLAERFTGIHLWSARAAVAHARLVPSVEPSQRLWKEVEKTFSNCISQLCPEDLLTDITNNESTTPANWERRTNAATVMLEWGLAQHHFDRPGKGRKSFDKARKYSGLKTEVTGADGVRTKFQTKKTAQMLVEAISTSNNNNYNKENNLEEETKDNNVVKAQAVEVEDDLLLNRIQFDDDEKNKVQDLNILDQAILLALCLDVKNTNPTGDELTAEEMGAYLARVLSHHDDWMLYSTALLERAWLEFERTHGRERAILQVQALADQHTNRLTLTQSTKKSIEESASAQDRLRNLHTIVYPPRWEMMKDLADRYANLGILMSAAELFTSIELWDEVVECYRRAGRAAKAEEIVNERLSIQETPRMWAALGDLKQEPEHWEKAVTISKGRFSTALIALGAYYFEKRDLIKAKEYYKRALEVRTIAPAVWFRLGTISMQLDQWDDALEAFSRVVQLEPEEHEAWANVAAIHMRNKSPKDAYPALVESLRHFRHNWRVWASKLYVCLDLKKYDEGVQACNSILDLKNQKQASDNIPPLEERCVRALVGGVLQQFHTAQEQVDEGAIDSAKRSLARVHALLNRLQSTNNPEPWLYETMAYFHEQIGGDGNQQVLDNLMKEYRALQTVAGWEKDDGEIKKICTVVSQICEIQQREGSPQALSKSKFLLNGVISKVKKSWIDASRVPNCIHGLEQLLAGLEQVLQEKKEQS